LRVLVTGASGFVGGWLRGELEAAGHEVLDGEEGGHPWLDVTDRALLAARLEELRPEAVAHLAGVAFAGDAAADPAQAFEVNVGGTLNLCEAVRRQGAPIAVLVAGSSEVYGSPAPADLPLTEGSAVAPVAIYGLSKAAQESVALAVAARCGMRLVVTRSFNHSGPGQRAEFVLPALARRVALVHAGQATSVPVGNLDVRRDFTDVRDVVGAYRLLLEALVGGRFPAGGAVLNVCSGRTLAIGDAVAELCRLAGVDPPIEADPRLVRPNDPPEIRGDPSALEAVTGWRPGISLDVMIADIWADAMRAVAAPAGGGTGA
jgi:GDP-4-dehydro-6-deoxy-D-mannose reductase